MVCSIVKTTTVRSQFPSRPARTSLLPLPSPLQNTNIPPPQIQEFIRSGCPNCESFLQLQNSPDTVAECTSAVFDSLITVGDPATSWVAKWQRLSTYLPGVYAVKVVGTLPDEVLAVLEDNNIRYVPRDGSAGDEDFAG
jgi:transcription elongation factor SPT4